MKDCFLYLAKKNSFSSLKCFFERVEYSFHTDGIGMVVEKMFLPGGDKVPSQ